MAADPDFSEISPDVAALRLDDFMALRNRFAARRDRFLRRFGKYRHWPYPRRLRVRVHDLERRWWRRLDLLVELAPCEGLSFAEALPLLRDPGLTPEKFSLLIAGKDVDTLNNYHRYLEHGYRPDPGDLALLLALARMIANSKASAR